jgi:hypothetical protein
VVTAEATREQIMMKHINATMARPLPGREQTRPAFFFIVHLLSLIVWLISLSAPHAKAGLPPFHSRPR